MEEEIKEYRRQKKIVSLVNRRNFVTDCIEEQVIPKSAPKKFKKLMHPFPACVKEFLQEERCDLFWKIECLKRKICGLGENLRKRLEKFDYKQKASLKAKLNSLCEHSDWKKVGNTRLVLNLMRSPISREQLQVLSLGLKFAVGLKKKVDIADLVSKNYRNNISDVENGFIQGMEVCMAMMADREDLVIPRRFLKALEDLRKRDDCVILSSDKGGGVVVMEKDD